MTGARKLPWNFQKHFQVKSQSQTSDITATWQHLLLGVFAACLWVTPEWRRVSHFLWHGPWQKVNESPLFSSRHQGANVDGPDHHLLGDHSRPRGGDAASHKLFAGLTLMLRHYGSSLWMCVCVCRGTKWINVKMAVSQHGKTNMWEDLGHTWMFERRTNWLFVDEEVAAVIHCTALHCNLTVNPWTFTSQSETLPETDTQELMYNFMTANVSCRLIVFKTRFQEVQLLFFLLQVLMLWTLYWRVAGGVNAPVLWTQLFSHRVAFCFVLESMSFYYFSKVGL